MAVYTERKIMSVNKVVLVGNLGNSPEVKNTTSGNSVANFSLATSESWNDKNGNKQEKTEWHRVVVWGKLADLCGKYLTKGRQVYVEGKLQTRQWEDKDGTKRYTTEVVASTVQFLGGAQKDGNRPEQNQAPSAPAPSDPSGFSMDDEIPF